MAAPVSSGLRLVCLAAGLIVLLGGALSRAQVVGPAADAYAKTDATFREIKDNVATAKERLDNVGQQLERVETFLKEHPEIARDERAALIRQLGDTRGTLQKTGEVLETFGNYADKVTQATDAVQQVQDLYQAFRSDQLSDKVRALAGAMEKYGGKVPILGSAIEAYGKVTTGLVDATDRLKQEIKETRNQSRLGSGTYSGPSDPRYKKLVEQFGKDFADYGWYPESPPEVYRPGDRPSEKSLDRALIWDQDAGEWYSVDGKINVEGIFRDVVTARGKRPTAAQLKHLAENDEQTKARQAMADVFADYFRAAAGPGVSPRSTAFVRLGEDSGKIMLALRDPAFRARFTYDGAFRGWTLEVLDAMRNDLVKQGRTAERSLGELDALLDKYDITLTSQEALPEVGTIRVVAWFPENAKYKFRSRWRLDATTVSVTGPGDCSSAGTRSGNSVQLHGSCGGCTGRESATLNPGGRMTFSGTYTCKENSSSGTGVGRWEVISAEPPAARNGKRP